jgi:hypothetical protein
VVTGDWRKLHNEELHYLYCEQGMIWVMIQRKMGWAGNVARMRKKTHAGFGEES